MPFDNSQVVVRGCTICDYEARVVEKEGADPLCPWCYGPTERRSIIGIIMPEHVAPGEKNPYAASLGRLGGLKGGPARAHKLSAKQRRDIAVKAARARWGKKNAERSGRALARQLRRRHAHDVAQMTGRVAGDHGPRRDVAQDHAPHPD